MADRSGQRPTTSKARRQRRKLTDEERIWFALKRFEPLRYGRAMEEISALGKQKQRDPAVVSRAISDAFRKGLVEIRTNEYAKYAREFSLEEDLKSKFKLPGAVVIRFAEPPPQLQGKNLEDFKAWNDELHSALGFSLARMIAAGGFVFGAGARIGIGSGRGVFFVVDWLAKLTKLRAINVQAFSLTGATYPQTHAKDGLRLDADTNVNIFAGKCFAASAKPNSGRKGASGRPVTT